MTMSPTRRDGATDLAGLKPIRCEHGHVDRRFPCREPATTTDTITLDTRTVVRHLCQRHAGGATHE